MKAMICLMFACVLTASTTWAQAPAPAAQGGQKVPLSEGLRRSYNTLKMNLTETAQKFDEADVRLHAVAGDSRLRRAARARGELAVQRVLSGNRRGESAPGIEPGKDEDDEGRHCSGARRLVRVLRSGVRKPDRPERPRARPAGPERSRARIRPHQPHRPWQRRVRDSDGVHAHQRHGPAVNRARHARAWSRACEVKLSAL